VTLKAIIDIEVNNVNDCSRVTLLHFITNIDCDVFSFWHFHLGHTIIHHGDNAFWKFYLPFKGIGEILLMIAFLENEQITFMLEFIDWTKSMQSIMFISHSQTPLCSGNYKTFHNI
jgi:hypothetical protein